MALTPPFSVCNEFCVGGGGAAQKNLGKITTQEQLNNLVTLSSGTYKFTSPYELTVNQVTQHKFEFIVTETTDKTYNYEMSMLSDGTNYRQDIACDKISRQIYRQGNINFASYAGYIFDSANDIEFRNREAKITNDRQLSIESNGILALKGQNLNFDTDGTLWVEASQMHFMGANMMLFHKPPKIAHPQNTGVWADAAYGMTYITVDNTATVTENIFTYMFAQDRTYLNIVESLTINISGTITNADGLCTGIHFNTGDVAPSVSYTVSGDTIINWQGTDCALDEGISVFAPQANMHYDIFITYMGGKVVGIVNGYVPATSNQ